MLTLLHPYDQESYVLVSMLLPCLTDLQRWLVLCIDGVHQRWGSGLVLQAGVGSRSQQSGRHLSSCSLHAGVHQSGTPGSVPRIWICLISTEEEIWWRTTPPSSLCAMKPELRSRVSVSQFWGLCVLALEWEYVLWDSYSNAQLSSCNQWSSCLRVNCVVWKLISRQSDGIKKIL